MIKRSTKIFLKSFVCSAIVFALISSFFILSQTRTNASQNSSYSSSNSRYAPKQNDKFTIMLTISSLKLQVPHSVFLLNLNAFEGKVYVLRLPATCLLSKNGESKVILKECFQKGGESSAAKAISQFFGIEVCRYVSFTDQEFISLIDRFEPTAIDILEDLSEVDRKNDIYIKIDRGRRLIGGSLMLDIFAYTKWKNGSASGFFESAEALSSFLSQNGSDLLREQEFILANAKTNLSALDFENRRELVSYLFSLPDACEGVKIYGEYQFEQTQFTLSQSTRTRVSALF